MIELAGEPPVARIKPEALEFGRDRRTPFQGRHFLDAMRGLFRWAAKAKLATDVTQQVANPPQPKTDGFPPWTSQHVAAYQRRWPIGTRERVWLDVLLYTGLRRGDAVRLGRQHVRDGEATIKTEKTGMVVTLTILPVLAETLRAGPCGDLTFIVSNKGRAFTKESFGNVFRAACREAGVPGSAHGVRKLAATTMADNGATEAQLEAVFGWRGGGMASLYTRSANRKRLARDLMSMLVPRNIEETNARTSFPEPTGKRPNRG